MKKIFLLIVCAALSATSVFAQNNENSEAVAFAMKMGMGWNLGNTLDAHENGVAIEGCWKGNGQATEKAFKTAKEAGFKSVRIPVTWLGHYGAAPDYTIEKAWLDRVEEVAGWAKKYGLIAIVNIHHDGHADGGKPDTFTWLKVQEAAKNEAVNSAIKGQLAALWTQIANRFKNEGDWLVFETMNEIHDGNWGNDAVMENPQDQYRVLNEWNQVALDAIRATGGNNRTRYVGIPSYVTQPGKAVQHLVLPKDVVEGRLMVAVHAYDPWDYAGSGAFSEWGHTGKDVVSNKAGEKEYVGMLDALYNKFVKNGIPVYFGEYGNVHRADAQAEAFRKYYLEYTIKAMRDRKIPVLFWDNGYDLTGDDAFGLIQHRTGKYIANAKEICKLMVQTWNNNDPNYTLDVIWQKAP